MCVCMPIHCGVASVYKSRCCSPAADGRASWSSWFHLLAAAVSLLLLMALFNLLLLLLLLRPAIAHHVSQVFVSLSLQMMLNRIECCNI